MPVKYDPDTMTKAIERTAHTVKRRVWRQFLREFAQARAEQVMREQRIMWRGNIFTSGNSGGVLIGQWDLTPVPVESIPPPPPRPTDRDTGLATGEMRLFHKLWRRLRTGR